MATPAWLGATSGQRPQASQINQFLGAHAATLLYTGTSQNAQTTAGSGGTATNGLYLAQSFTTSGAYTASRVVLTLAVTGSPNPATVTIQGTSGGAPNGTVLGAIVVPPTYVPGSATAISIPLPASLSASTQYWIVINAVGSAGNLYTWSKSNQVSGASTSPDGTSWTAQSYGLLYNVFAGTTGSLVHTYEDGDARWTTFGFNANGSVSTLQEYTVAQGANQYVYSSRSFAYSGTVLTAIS